MKPFRFESAALAEYKHEIRYYQKAQSRALALDFMAEFERCLGLIRSHPSIGRAIGASGLMQFALDRFPFHIIYGIQNDELLVVAVAHQKRRPGYWTNRFKSEA